MTQDFAITGMTCSNCARHVTTALSAIPGVTKATVSLDAQQATVESDREIPRTEVSEALEEAGYGLA
jgi:copper chaperone CopZ